MSDRTCARCGKSPADGFASIWTAETGERWYCHGDDGLSCYVATEADLTTPVAYGVFDLATHTWAETTEEN